MAGSIVGTPVTALGIPGGGSISASITVAAGDYIVAFVGGLLGTTATIALADDIDGSTGWTNATTTTPSSAIRKSAVCYKAAGGTYVVTATFGSSDWLDRSLVLCRVSGCDSSGIDKTTGQHQGSATGTDSVTSGNPATTTNANDFVIGCTWNYNDSKNASAGTGFTAASGSPYAADGNDVSVESKSVSSTGVYPGLFTPNTNGSAWDAHVVILKEAASGTTGTGSAAISSFGASGSGAETFTGSGSAASQSFGASGSGAETFTGSGSAAASAFGASGAGSETFTGTGSAAAKPFGASGAGTVGNAFIGSGAAAASPFAAAGSGAETFTGAASAALRSFGAAGAGTVTANITGSGSAAASRFGATGSGFTGAAETPLTPPFTTWVDSVVLTVAVDSVRLTLGQPLQPRKTTDTYPITNTLMNNGVPVNLAGYTVTINIVDRASRTPKRANGACTVTDAPNGRVSYTPVSGDVDTAGDYDVEWKAVSPGGTPYHFPQSSYEHLEIQPALG